VPFLGDDDAPAFAPHALEEVLPELPADLAAADAAEAELYARGEWAPLTSPPCLCRHCASPSDDPAAGLGRYASAAEEFGAHFRAAKVSTALAWRAAAALHDQVLAERGPSAAEHVGSHLALLMGVHSRTGTSVCVTAVRASRDLPRLAELVLAGRITDKHVQALLDEVGKWTDSDEQARALLEQTLALCEERAQSSGWPTPGELKKALQRVAILNDLRAAEKRRKSIAERRGVSLWQSGPGGATLTIEGPDLPLVLAHRAIQERAEAMRHLEGDTRSRDQREYDAAIELLTVDAEQPPGGGVSARPTTGLDGEPLELVVRGSQVAVVMPYSVAKGGDHELAEVPGLGPILPSTARALLEHADSLQRVAVDATTGTVLAVDDKVPGPNRTNPKTRARDTSASQVTSHQEVEPLSELAGRKVIRRDLNTSAYRVPGRLRRFVEHRDRTCCFPGCTVPGRFCDVDHREEWPRGRTDPENCHCLCRRHHRAKQFYFAEVVLDPLTGDTLWVTYDGETYRRAQPRY
jgi:hypothetical protein